MAIVTYTPNLALENDQPLNDGIFEESSVMVDTRYLSGHLRILYFASAWASLCPDVSNIANSVGAEALQACSSALEFSVGFWYQSYFHCLLQSQMRWGDSPTTFPLSELVCLTFLELSMCPPPGGKQEWIVLCHASRFLLATWLGKRGGYIECILLW